MELAVIARDVDAAMEQAEIALAKAQFGWHLETTERNLRLIRETRAARGEDLAVDQGAGRRARLQARANDGGAEGIVKRRGGPCLHRLCITTAIAAFRMSSTAVASRTGSKKNSPAPIFTDDDKAFIEGASYLFIATADAEGRPDCSFKGGMPGFVRLTGPSELAFPDYDGNGMFKSLGNLMVVNPNIGLLFIATA